MAYDFKIQQNVPIPSVMRVGSKLVRVGLIEKTFAEIKAWTERAVPVSSESAPELGTLATAFLEDEFKPSLFAPPTNQSETGLVSFGISGKAINRKTRFAHPVHFVAMRALELVPAVKMFLKDETGARDAKRRIVRGEDQKIFRVNLSVARKTQGIGRFLFDVPPDGELHEKRSEQDEHRKIIPRTHVITKYRPQNPPQSSNETLQMIEATLLKRSDLAYTSPEMMRVLRTLLALGDKWHWDELVGRLVSDQPRKFPV